MGESLVLSTITTGPALLPQSLQGQLRCENGEGQGARQKMVWLLNMGDKLSGSESEPHVPQRAFRPIVQCCQTLSRF